MIPYVVARGSGWGPDLPRITGRSRKVRARSKVRIAAFATGL